MLSPTILYLMIALASAVIGFTGLIEEGAVVAQVLSVLFLITAIVRFVSQTERPFR